LEELMDRNNRNALIAAAAIMLAFVIAAFYLPTVMLAVGNVSTVAAGVVAILFVAAFFLVFWLRGKSQGRRDK
jgi:Flp pilus assembly protein TadB